MAEYERTLSVDADPDRVFQHLSERANLLADEGHGQIRRDPQTRRIEWEADADSPAGWVQVTAAGALDADVVADVTMHLSGELTEAEEAERHLESALRRIKQRIEA